MIFRFIAEALQQRFVPGRHQLPGLIIPGAMKSGTTSIFEYLRGHPQLLPSHKKEIHYFDLNFRRGVKWYARQFPQCVGKTIGFESSPYYLFDPRVPARVRELLPNVKLLILLRDPVERAFSHYQNNRRLGREPLSFEDAIAAEPERLCGEEERLLSDPHAVSLVHRQYSYLGRGIYHQQLTRWRTYFPAEQMLVIDAGRFFANPLAVVSEVIAFLGLDPWVPLSLVPWNEGGYRNTIKPETRSRLERYFEPHEMLLAELIGWCPSASRRISVESGGS
jgi:hypothetical protein